MDLKALFASNAFTRTQVEILRRAFVPVTTVELLGTPTAGLRAMVSDATASTFFSIVAGGGTNVVPVFADGTNWRIG